MAILIFRRTIAAWKVIKYSCITAIGWNLAVILVWDREAAINCPQVLGNSHLDTTQRPRHHLLANVSQNSGPEYIISPRLIDDWIPRGDCWIAKWPLITKCFSERWKYPPLYPLANLKYSNILPHKCPPGTSRTIAYKICRVLWG